MDVLDHPLAFTTPRRLSDVRNWHEHIPFAMYLVSVLRPRLVVELGTHRGDSYCAFCEAVAELRLPAACYAVDTWRGDAHAGDYGPEVLAELRAYHDPLYGGFSELLQTTFDDARGRFEDGSIDLLHIDGLHTYDAVRHDFDTWRSALSKHGIVLFHDSAVRVEGFGVWRLVDELRAEYPVFELVHGHGLAVVFVGADVPAELSGLATLDAERLAAVRALFEALGAGVRRAGEAHETTMRAEQLAAETAELTATLLLREGEFEERLTRVEGLTEALVQSRVLRIARGLRRVLT